jgi:hypothetical protein
MAAWEAARAEQSQAIPSLQPNEEQAKSWGWFLVSSIIQPFLKNISTHVMHDT